MLRKHPTVKLLSEERVPVASLSTEKGQEISNDGDIDDPQPGPSTAKPSLKTSMRRITQTDIQSYTKRKMGISASKKKIRML